jgi:hypothetical protein
MTHVKGDMDCDCGSPSCWEYCWDVVVASDPLRILYNRRPVAKRLWDEAKASDRYTVKAKRAKYDKDASGGERAMSCVMMLLMLMLICSSGCLAADWDADAVEGRRQVYVGDF